MAGATFPWCLLPFEALDLKWFRRTIERSKVWFYLCKNNLCHKKCQPWIQNINWNLLVVIILLSSWLCWYSYVACSSLKSRANAIFYLIFTSINIPYRISPEWSVAETNLVKSFCRKHGAVRHYIGITSRSFGQTELLNSRKLLWTNSRVEGKTWSIFVDPS